VIDRIEAGRVLVEQFGATFPVKVAFWLKGSEDQEWTLYIASEAINETDFGRAYGQAVVLSGRLGGRMTGFAFDPYRLRVVSANDPVARAAIEIQKRFPPGMPTRYRGPQLGGIGIEEVYIYPSPVTVTS